VGKALPRHKTILALSALHLSSCVVFSIESDRSLLRTFNRYRPIFERVITLEGKKGLFSIYHGSGRCELSMKPRKFDQGELKALCSEMKRIGVERIYSSEAEIEFLASRESYTDYESYIFRKEHAYTFTFFSREP
jgi:hypothetical protein